MESERGPPALEVASNGGAPHVRRLRTLKRKKEEKESTKNQVKLERVLGLTVTSNASLATAPATGQLLTKNMRDVDEGIPSNTQQPRQQI